MSDSEEDRMDVDVQFNATDSTKGKRIASDLPVEAEDSLPWVEKYRPDTLDDVQGHQDILATINKFVETNVCFNLYIYLEKWLTKRY
jgi:replication factor C subunit 3/5